ncbi:aminoacetone oxidase family FAD-binding enzyme [bacterium]|jgi:predicted Rossmann fold flavoprotein|nr:aminoacetone oxidase family FAD-binding enzyme [bacterium]MDB4664387.1 aminoacetone oxidase family FAD-binding enzyme [bacterium]
MHVVVIGAGAAGLMAAHAAAKQQSTVVLLEKNNKTGVKILMSGGTRCNLTHDTDARGIAEAFGHAKRFLQPSLGGFPPKLVVGFFESAGVATKVESTGKVFPVSNRAVQVRDALHRYAVDAGVEIRTGSGVTGIRPDGQNWIVETEQSVIKTDRVIVTTGGKSWPGCGTTGDAYAWMTKLGHDIERTRPALVPLLGGEQWMTNLSGLVVDDSIVTVLPVSGKQKPLAQRRGSLLFTHFGFSGPAAMDVSGAVTAASSFDQVRMIADLMPFCSEEELKIRLSDRHDGGRSKVSSLLSLWLPNRLASGIIAQLGQDARLAELSKTARNRLLQDLKRLQLPVRGTRGFEKAEVTAGGVRLDQVNPRTLESRIHKGLFIAGELLDVDGPIGGYNFQAAFSTGRAAGIAASA